MTLKLAFTGGELWRMDSLYLLISVCVPKGTDCGYSFRPTRFSMLDMDESTS